MALPAELSEVIQRNLPEMVGKELRDRLEKGEKDAAELARLRQRAGVEESLNTKQRDLENRASKLAETEARLAARDTNLTLREGLIELREKYAADRVTEMRSVVQDVFRNNYLKYMERGNAPLAVPGSASCGGYTAAQAYDKTVEREG